MTAALHGLLQGLGTDIEAGRWLAATLLIALRLLPLAVLSTPLGGGTATNLLRLAVAAVLALALAPSVVAGPALFPEELLGLFLCGARELLVGTVFAIAVALPFFALRWAGELTDLWRGSVLYQALAQGEHSSPIGSLYLMTGLALFFSLGGHRVAIDAFAATLVRVPVGSALAAAGLYQTALGSVELLGSAMAFSAAFSAPVAATLVLSELGLGLLGRAAPQIPLFFAAMPLRAALALGAALLALSALLSFQGDLFLSSIRQGSDLVDALRP